jgi:hypothetical protein
LLCVVAFLVFLSEVATAVLAGAGAELAVVECEVPELPQPAAARAIKGVTNSARFKETSRCGSRPTVSLACAGAVERTSRRRRGGENVRSSIPEPTTLPGARKRIGRIEHQ